MNLLTMKALIAEYTMHHDPGLAPEGLAMYDVLSRSFTRCGYEVVSPGPGDFCGEIKRIAPACDVGLVIAPDYLLSRFTLAMETVTHNLGCGSMNVAVCANKQRAGKILASHGIPVPEEVLIGRRVVKPVSGCGAQGVRITVDPAREGEFGQKFIEGEHYSVSIIAGRIVGEACLYYTGAPAVALALNRQLIEITGDGRFHYQGGETPVHHPREKEIVDTALRSVTVLGCQGYAGVDVVVSDKVYVVDVNPRITTSIVGITATMEEEIADILVRASKGETPGNLHFTGTVSFDPSGRITRKKETTGSRK